MKMGDHNAHTDSRRSRTTSCHKAEASTVPASWLSGGVTPPPPPPACPFCRGPTPQSSPLTTQHQWEGEGGGVPDHPSTHQRPSDPPTHRAKRASRGEGGGSTEEGGGSSPPPPLPLPVVLSL